MSHSWQRIKFLIFDLQGQEALQVQRASTEKKQDLCHLSL